MEHFCPICGEMHGAAETVEHLSDEQAELEHGAPTDNEVTLAAIEALENVATTALITDTIEDLAEEETEQLEEVTDAVEEVAEEESEVALVEAVGDGAPEPEALEDDDEDELEEVAGEPTMVEPPPREEEEHSTSSEDGAKRSRSAFARRHRR